MRSYYLLAYAFILLGALVLYVLVVYPLIPQGIGGGKATPVQLVIEKDALPLELVRQNNETPSDASPADVKTVVLPATLLYLTKEYFFIAHSSGARLSIKSGSVQAVHWNPVNAEQKHSK
jgi:hypothetical protein